MESLTKTIKRKPKVPITKRRKQAKKACLHCRRTKTGCSDERPCKRCVTLGIGDTCRDAPKKDKTVIKYVVADQFPDVNKISSYPPGYLENILSKCTTVAETIVADKNANIYEKDYIKQEIEKLKKEQREAQNKIVELQKSLQTQQMFSDLPLTRWRVLCDGVCQLLSFSNGFIKLIERPANDLYKFTCIDLYPRCYHSKMQVLYRILGSCRIDSVTARVVIQTGTGKQVDVFLMVNVDLDNPGCVTICMEDFNPNASIYGNAPVFEPLVTKLIDPIDKSPPLVHQTTPSPPQPTQNNSYFSYFEDSSPPIQQNSPPMSHTQNFSLPIVETNNINFTQQYQSNINDVNPVDIFSNNSLNPLELLDELTYLGNDDIFNFIPDNNKNKIQYRKLDLECKTWGQTARRIVRFIRLFFTSFLLIIRILLHSYLLYKSFTHVFLVHFISGWTRTDQVYYVVMCNGFFVQ